MGIPRERFSECDESRERDRELHLQCGQDAGDEDGCEESADAVQYDSYKRVTQVRHYAGGVEDVTARVDYSYDTNPYDGSYSQYTAGRLTARQYQVNGMTFTEMYSYTQPGQVTKKKMRVAKYFDRPYPYQGMWAQAELEGRQEYDNEGRVTRLTYPAATGGGGQSYDYGYDTMGRLKTMQDPNDPYHGWIISDATYGPAGEMFTMSGVVNETRTYNSRLQLSSFNSTTYNYGTTANNGRIVSETASGETVTYQYDELNRLLKAETVATPGWGQQFTYDAFGNLTGKSGTPNHAAAPTMTLVVSRATNRVGGYTYDANGNQLTTATQGLSYDFENRMVASDNWNNTGMKYGYDPDNRRVYGASWSYNNGTGQYTYTNQLVYYWSAAGQRLGSYALTLSAGTPPSVPPSVVLTWSGDRVYFGGKLLRREGPAWTGEDRLGSVGQYYPYGEARGTDQGRFATYDRDAGGLDYAVNRWYSSTLGRFTSPDPYRASGGPADPGSWNRYAYVNDDPVSFLDPFGTTTCKLDSNGWLVCYDSVTVNGKEPIRITNLSGGGGGVGGPSQMLGLDPKTPANVMVARSLALDFQRLVKDGIYDDCQGLVAFLSSLAIVNGNNKALFIRGIGLLVPSGIAANSVLPFTTGNVVYLNRGQPSGFAAAYQNSTPDNPTTGWNGDQAHHWAAFFEFGYVHGGGVVGNATADLYESFQSLFGQLGPTNDGDQRLGEVAVQLGAELAAGTINPEDVAGRVQELCKK